MSADDITWAAQLFERLGQMTLKYRRDKPTHKPQAYFQLRLEDEAQLRRFQKITGVGSVVRWAPTKSNPSPLWQWEVKGYHNAFHIVGLFWYLFSDEGREHAFTILTNCARPGPRIGMTGVLWQ